MRGLAGMICGCYSLLLVLYPRSLREQYGAEMVGVLREELMEDAGTRAVLRTVLRAFTEVVTIGIPERIRSEIPAAAPLAVCTSSAVLYGLLFVLHDTGPLDAFMRRWLGVHCP